MDFDSRAMLSPVGDEPADPGDLRDAAGRLLIAGHAELLVDRTRTLLLIGGHRLPSLARGKTSFRRNAGGLWEIEFTVATDVLEVREVTPEQFDEAFR